MSRSDLTLLTPSNLDLTWLTYSKNNSYRKRLDELKHFPTVGESNKKDTDIF